MTSSGTRREARGEGKDPGTQSSRSSFPVSSPLAARPLPLALTFIALCLIVWGFLQCDVPLARFLRTVHNPSLDRIGDAVGLLGSGWTLVAMSSTIALAGLAFKLPRFRTAGFQGLIAHGLAALCVQALKRGIGRPRPRFTHGDTFQLAPSLTSGFDSFPSGHATASFAVASVLARHFPRLAWVLYTLAGLIGISRIIRGSHFPTDVVVGTTLGLLVGFLVANPAGIRWKSVVSGFVSLLPYLTGAFALLWIAMHRYEGGPSDLVALSAGVVIVVLGAGSRLCHRLELAQQHSWLPTVPTANGAIGLGLAVSTGSALVFAVGVLVSLAWWLACEQPDQSAPLAAEPMKSPRSKATAYAGEAALVVGLCLALGTIQGLKGVLPVL